MQLGEMIANFFAALLLACILGAIFVLASQPIWPEQAMGRMVILVPPDGVTTGSIKAVTHSQLPDSVEGNLVQPRPQRNLRSSLDKFVKQPAHSACLHCSQHY
jgi:hypothetical protein